MAYTGMGVVVAVDSFLPYFFNTRWTRLVKATSRVRIGSKPGPDRVRSGPVGSGRDRVGTGSGPGRVRVGSGSGPGRDRVGTGSGPGRDRVWDGSGTGLGPGLDPIWTLSGQPNFREIFENLTPRGPPRGKFSRKFDEIRVKNP